MVEASTPPNKRSRADIVALDKRHVWHPYTPMGEYIEHGRPLVIERALGSRLFDVDGKSYLDGNSSWWTSLLGHNHPRLVAALQKQASMLCHTAFAGITHEPAVELAERLVQVAPSGLTRVFYSDNGSTAVEAALKMALQFHFQNGAPERRRILSIQHAFHGETLGVTALGGVPAFRVGQANDAMPVCHLPSPADGLDEAISALERELDEHGEETAALVIEPLIQGAGGMLIHSPEYLTRARQLTERSGVLLVVDEVFTGYGRTGTFWAVDQAGISPDILCSAKGLSGGVLPFAATLSTERVFDGFLGDRSRAFFYGHTYAGNPLGARVGAEVLDVYRDEGIIEGIGVRAGRIAALFAELGQLPGVRGARSLGMCGRLELGSGSDYLADGGWRVFDAALARGAYLRPLGSVVYLVPPLNIPLADLDLLLDIVGESVRRVLADGV